MVRTVNKYNMLINDKINLKFYSKFIFIPGDPAGEPLMATPPGPWGPPMPIGPRPPNAIPESNKIKE